MKVTKINTHFVLERFPEHQEIIKHLFKNNPNFQTLCTDYYQCARAVKFWSKSDLCEAPQRRIEYETLLSELETEIVEHIQRTTKGEWIY